MILVVDNNAAESFLLSRRLADAHMDHQVRVVCDGQEALDFLFRTAPVPYAVFLDVELPGLGGIELLQQIRHEPRFHALTVIVMTGSLDPEDAEVYARLGVSAFMPKPISLDLFRQILDLGESGYSFGRPVDPHFAEMASSML